MSVPKTTSPAVVLSFIPAPPRYIDIVSIFSGFFKMGRGVRASRAVSLNISTSSFPTQQLLVLHGNKTPFSTHFNPQSLLYLTFVIPLGIFRIRKQLNLSPVVGKFFEGSKNHGKKS
jgi:hypothetical protein